MTNCIFFVDRIAFATLRVLKCKYLVSMSCSLVHLLTLTCPVSGRATALAIARDCDIWNEILLFVKSH